MLRIISTAGASAVLATALSGAAFAEGAKECDGFAWPHYPVSCLTTPDGNALGDRRVRMAVAAPSPDIEASDRAKPIHEFLAPSSEQDFPHLDDRNLREQPPPATEVVTVWRRGIPKTYLLHPH